MSDQIAFSLFAHIVSISLAIFITLVVSAVVGNPVKHCRIYRWAHGQEYNPITGLRVGEQPGIDKLYIEESGGAESLHFIQLENKELNI